MVDLTQQTAVDPDASVSVAADNDQQNVINAPVSSITPNQVQQTPVVNVTQDMEQQKRVMEQQKHALEEENNVLKRSIEEAELNFSKPDLATLCKTCWKWIRSQQVRMMVDCKKCNEYYCKDCSDDQHSKCCKPGPNIGSSIPDIEPEAQFPVFDFSGFDYLFVNPIRGLHNSLNSFIFHLKCKNTR